MLPLYLPGKKPSCRLTFSHISYPKQDLSMCNLVNIDYTCGHPTQKVEYCNQAQHGYHSRDTCMAVGRNPRRYLEYKSERRNHCCNWVCCERKIDAAARRMEAALERADARYQRREINGQERKEDRARARAEYAAEKKRHEDVCDQHYRRLGPHG